MKKDPTIFDFFKTSEEFEVKLSIAIKNAHTAWETRFCEDLHNRYLEYGCNIFLTKKGISKLQELQVPYEKRPKPVTTRR